MPFGSVNSNSNGRCYPSQKPAFLYTYLGTFCAKYKPIFILPIRFPSNLDFHKIDVGPLGTTNLAYKKNLCPKIL